MVPVGGSICSAAWEAPPLQDETGRPVIRQAPHQPGALSRLAPNCNFEVTFLPLASKDGKEGKSMRVSDFQASIFHLTWMVQIPVSTSRRNRNIRELLHCPPSFNELPERGICHLALQMPTLPRKSGGLCPALPLATHLFLSFCLAPSICLHPQVHPPTSHL